MIVFNIILKQPLERFFVIVPQIKFVTTHIHAALRLRELTARQKFKKRVLFGARSALFRPSSLRARAAALVEG